MIDFFMRSNIQSNILLTLSGADQTANWSKPSKQVRETEAIFTELEVKVRPPRANFLNNGFSISLRYLKQTKLINKIFLISSVDRHTVL